MPAIFRLLVIACLSVAASSSPTGTTTVTMDCPTKCVCTSDASLGEMMSCSATLINELPYTSTGELVKFLDLSNNDIIVLPPLAFDQYPSVEAIIIGMSFLSVFNVDTFKNLNKLTSLDMNGNNIRFFDPLSFSGNERLYSLVLSGNPIVISHEEPFLVSSSLKSLDLSFCKLTYLSPSSLSLLPNLEVLDLSSNALRSLSPNTLKTIPKLIQVNLGNNLWSCDCDTNDALKMADGFADKSTQRKPLKCFDSFGNVKKVFQVGDTIPCGEVFTDGAQNDTDDEMYLQTITDTNETIVEKYEEEIIVDEDDNIIVEIVNKVYQINNEQKDGETFDDEEDVDPSDNFIMYENHQIIAIPYKDEDFDDIEILNDELAQDSGAKNSNANTLGMISFKDCLRWKVLILPLVSFLISFSGVILFSLYKYRCKKNSYYSGNKQSKSAESKSELPFSFFTVEKNKNRKYYEEKCNLIKKEQV